MIMLGLEGDTEMLVCNEYGVYKINTETKQQTKIMDIDSNNLIVKRIILQIDILTRGNIIYKNADEQIGKQKIISISIAFFKKIAYLNYQYTSYVNELNRKISNNQNQIIEIYVLNEILNTFFIIAKNSTDEIIKICDLFLPTKAGDKNKLSIYRDLIDDKMQDKKILTYFDYLRWVCEIRNALEHNIDTECKISNILYENDNLKKPSLTINRTVKLIPFTLESTEISTLMKNIIDGLTESFQEICSLLCLNNRDSEFDLYIKKTDNIYKYYIKDGSHFILYSN